MKLNQGSFVKRALMVGLLAGSGVLTVTSFAMHGAGPAGGCEAKMSAGMQAKSAARWDARRDAHLAALKQKLNLQPAQEAAWNQFVGAAKVDAGQRPDRRALGREFRQELQQLKTPERLDRMQAMAQQRQAKMQARSAAIKSFYAQLTPEQQSVFDATRQSKGRHGHGHRHGHGFRQS